eukprot:gene6250-10258_t
MNKIYSFKTLDPNHIGEPKSPEKVKKEPERKPGDIKRGKPKEAPYRKLSNQITKPIRVNYYVGKLPQMPLISINKKIKISYPINIDLCEKLLSIKDRFDENEVTVQKNLIRI